MTHFFSLATIILNQLIQCFYAKNICKIHIAYEICIMRSSNLAQKKEHKILHTSCLGEIYVKITPLMLKVIFQFSDT